MSKGKTPSLIGGSNGKPQFVTAKRKGACSRCKKEIINGEKCSDVPKLRAPFAATKRFCMGCIKEILEQTKVDITSLEQDLAGTRHSNESDLAA